MNVIFSSCSGWDRGLGVLFCRSGVWSLDLLILTSVTETTDTRRTSLATLRWWAPSGVLRSELFLVAEGVGTNLFYEKNRTTVLVSSSEKNAGARPPQGKPEGRN